MHEQVFVMLCLQVQNGVDISVGVDNKGFSVDSGDVNIAVTETSNTIPDNSKVCDALGEYMYMLKKLLVFSTFEENWKKLD